jgi:hypothetical protein
MDFVERRLAQLIFTYWQLPEREAHHFLKVLAKSPCARVVVLRQQLALAETRVPTVQGLREVDLAHVFDAVVTPQFLLALVHDLVVVGSLTQPQRQVVEECILECVGASGAWKAV